MKAPASIKGLSKDSYTDLKAMSNDVDMAITNVLETATNCNRNKAYTIKVTMVNQTKCVADKMSEATNFKEGVVDM